MTTSCVKCLDQARQRWTQPLPSLTSFKGRFPPYWTRKGNRPHMTLNPERRTEPATPEEVRQRSEEWTNEQLACRSQQHRWQPLRAVLNRQHGYYLCSWTCDRCGTEKSAEIDADTGEVFGSWYAYADGYLASGMGRLDSGARNTIRLSAIQRTFPRTTLRAAQARKAQPHTRAAKLRKLKD